MAKKGFLGTVISVAATLAAVGGACYIFRDKIKESKLYKDLNMDDHLMNLKNYWDEHKPCKETEEDFFDEDEFIFEDADTSDRNYVSVSFTQNDDAFEDIEDTPDVAEEASEENEEASPAPTEEDSFDVPVISFDTEATADNTTDTVTEEGDDSPIGYDMEGLSDVSEDPDVLMEQDLLDETPTL